MIEYQSLTDRERRLPLVAIANGVPFLFALISIGIALDDGFGVEYWGFGEFFLLACLIYFPVGLLFPLLAMKLNLPLSVRDIISDLLIIWGGLNLIITAIFLAMVTGVFEHL